MIRVCQYAIDRGVFCYSLVHRDSEYCSDHLLRIAEIDNMWRDILTLIRKARENMEGSV